MRYSFLTCISTLIASPLYAENDADSINNLTVHTAATPVDRVERRKAKKRQKAKRHRQILKKRVSQLCVEFERRDVTCSKELLLRWLTTRYGSKKRIPLKILRTRRIIEDYSNWYQERRAELLPSEDPSEAGGNDGIGLRGWFSSSPSPSPTPRCARGYRECAAEDSYCCYNPKTEQCLSYEKWGSGVAICGPKSASQCPSDKPKFCKGDTSKDQNSICCNEEDTCKWASNGIAICEPPVETCKKPCRTLIGYSGASNCRYADLCCESNQTCTPVFDIWNWVIPEECEHDPAEIMLCITNQCDTSKGETTCPGKDNSIRCCSPGTTCAPSKEGTPNCIPNDRLPKPDPSASGSPSGSPSR